MARLKQRTKRVSLAYMGEEWHDAYIEMNRLSWADSKPLEEISNENKADAIAESIKTIQYAFVSGKSLDEDGRLVDLVKEDIEQFDLEALKTLYRAVLGLPDPKELPPSATPLS